MNHRRLVTGIASALFCILLTGCYDTKQEITLNPDGSGRAVIESVLVPFDFLDAHATTGRDPAAQFVQKLVEKSEGVDAWRDITCREMEDGRMYVRATAYFPDLNRFKTDLNGFLRFSVTRTAGTLTVIPRADTSDSPVTVPTAEQPETAETIARERRQFRAIEPVLNGSLGALKLDTTFELPGPIKLASNFESNAGGGLRLRFEGARMLSALQHVLFDPEIARQRMDGKRLGDLIDSTSANQILYGQPAPVRAECKPVAKSLFDYAAEVAAARRNFPALAKNFGLGISPPNPSRPIVAGAPATIKVTGIAWRFDDAAAKQERPSWLWDNWDEARGYSLRLRADLPGSILAVTDVKVTRAVSIEGATLKAKASIPHVLPQSAAGLTNVNFEIFLGQPAPGSRGWSEVAGVLECSSAENLRAVDLFSGRLQPGTRGPEQSDEIEFIGSGVENQEKIVFRAGIEPGRLLWVKALGDGGQSLELSEKNHMTIGTRHTYTYTAPGRIPRNGRLVVGVLSGEKIVRIPFVLTNINLLGQPLAAR